MPLRQRLARPAARLVPLEFVPVGSPGARRLLPDLDHRAAQEEITVVGDGGQVYRGAAAWVVCLWALREHRALAHRLSTPAGLRVARGAVLAAAKWREAHRVRTAAPRAPHWGGTAYVRRDGWVYTPSPAGPTEAPPAPRKTVPTVPARPAEARPTISACRPSGLTTVIVGQALGSTPCLRRTTPR